MGKDKYDEHLEQQRLGREAQRGWKALFKHSVVGPLVIGAIIGGVGYIFEYEPLIWIGVGINAFGWFVAVRDG